MREDTSINLYYSHACTDDEIMTFDESLPNMDDDPPDDDDFPDDEDDDGPPMDDDDMDDDGKRQILFYSYSRCLLILTGVYSTCI